MKHVFSLLLIFILFANVLTSKRSLKMRIVKVAQAMKLISDSSEKKLRNLEQTDVPETRKLLMFHQLQLFIAAPHLQINPKVESPLLKMLLLTQINLFPQKVKSQIRKKPKSKLLNSMDSKLQGDLEE